MLTKKQMRRIEVIKRNIVEDMEKSDERASMIWEAMSDNIPANGERLAAMVSIMVNELVHTPNEVKVPVTLAIVELIIQGVMPPEEPSR